MFASLAIASPAPAPAPAPAPVARAPIPEIAYGAQFAEIPSLDEVLQFAKGPAGIPEASARSFFDWHQGNNTWLNKAGKMIDWRYKVKAWAVRDAAQPQAQRQQGPRNGKPPRQVFPDGTEINEQGELDVFKPPMENGREIQLPDPRRKKWNDKITAQCQ